MPRPVPAPLRLRLALAAACLAAALPAGAALTWDTREQRFPLSAEQAEARTVFGFTNTGNRPIAITGVHAGCNCTTATATKSSYAPGERGEIVVDFRRGNREGEYRQGITVTTDDGASTTLQFVADIEALVRFDTRYVFWTATEERIPKRMHLTFAAGRRAALTGVRSSDPQFRVAFAPVAGTEGAFVLTVTPPATATNFSVLTIRYRLGEAEAESELSAVARTLPAPAAPAQPAAKPQP